MTSTSPLMGWPVQVHLSLHVHFINQGERSIILKAKMGDSVSYKNVDFLDLTITIKDGKVMTKTFQKAMNLYLYIPSQSVHPDGMMK